MAAGFDGVEGLSGHFGSWRAELHSTDAPLDREQCER
jgi:hypothetical protein